MLHIALAGNPNVGKSSLFNLLTGLNQKVGNFPGVTIERKTGSLALPDGSQALVTDLPGTYSLYPKSPDERVVSDFLTSSDASQCPDLILLIADASNLKRNLLLYTQIADLGYPILIALNQLDIADNKGVNIDISRLSKKLQCPVIAINARKGKGIAELLVAISQWKKNCSVEERAPFYQFPEAQVDLVRTVSDYLTTRTPYQAFLFAHHFEYSKALTDEQKQAVAFQVKKYNFEGRSLQAAETMSRYTVINQLLSDVMTVATGVRPSWSIKLDKVLTHSVWGYVSFLVILMMIFQAIFSWASIPMDWIDSSIAGLSDALREAMPEGLLTSLLLDGVLAGVGGIIIFVPQIAILFAFISILEDTGYMSRVMFIMDRLMRRFGLNGRSVVPLVSGVACAVPAIMSTRVIDNKRDRLVTIFVTPFMSCSARLPVFAVLIALVIPEYRLLGLVNIQGLVLMALYLFGVVAALLSALVIQRFIPKEQRSFFVMELPVYKWPRWSNVIMDMYTRSKAFVLEAGKVILAISVLLWALSSFGPSDKMDAVEQRVAHAVALHEVDSSQAAVLESSLKLEASYAGILGKTIEPVIKPLGFDWKIGIALITSFAAREVFVGTMSTIYNMGSEAAEDTDTIKERMAREINPETGKPMYDLALGVSLMLFYLLAMQCISTIATTYRETRDWRYPVWQLGYMSGLAYVVSLIAYQILR